MSTTGGNNQSEVGHQPMMDDGGERRMKKTGRIITLIVAVVAAALAVGFFIIHAKKSAAESDLAKETADAASQPIPVDVVQVQPAPPFQSLTFPGETAGWYESTVYARVSGYIGDWKVDIGDKVQKGQLMCDIDTPELDADVVAAQAKLKASEADVAVEQANADFAESSYQRWWTSPKGYVS